MPRCFLPVGMGHSSCKDRKTVEDSLLKFLKAFIQQMFPALCAEDGPTGQADSPRLHETSKIEVN